MKLKKGITGNCGVKEEQMTFRSIVSQFKASLYPIEYSGAYKILEFKDEEISKNYYRISIANKLKNDSFDILINSMYPYYCGVNPNGEWLNLIFIDLPIEIRNCVDPYFKYLSPVELNSKFEKSDLLELSEAELEEIKYWKPSTFGEIIFNGYD